MPARRRGTTRRTTRSSKSKKASPTGKESDEEILVKKKEKKTPLPPPKEVTFPPSLGKRMAIHFEIERPEKKKKGNLIRLREHHSANIPLLPSPIHILPTDPEDEEREKRIQQDGQAAFSLGIGSWLEAELSKEYEKDKKLFFLSSSKAHLNINERLRLEYVHGCSLYPTELMDDFQSSLIIKLYQRGFALGNQSILHPYDVNTEPFLNAIDHHRMPPDLLDLLEEIPCYYYDGCLMVSLIDYRFDGQHPSIQKVLLRPDTESIVYDLERALSDNNEQCKEEDIIKAEQVALQAMRIPLCLNPSPKVSIAANIMHYNRTKFQLAHDILKERPMEKEKVRMPGIFYNTLNYMANKLDNPIPPRSPPRKQKEIHSLLSLLPKTSTLKQLQERSSIPPQTEEQTARRPELPLIPASHIPYDRSSSVVHEKTSLCFSRSNGSNYYQFDMEKGDTLGYAAKIRVGTQNESSVARFVIQNADNASKFINQLITTCMKNGCQLKENVLPPSIPIIPGPRPTIPASRSSMPGPRPPTAPK